MFASRGSVSRVCRAIAGLAVLSVATTVGSTLVAGPAGAATSNALDISPVALPGATVGEPYTQQLYVTGNPSPATGPFAFTYTASPAYVVTPGCIAGLPPGMTLSSSGLISGTPLQVVQCGQFLVGVTDPAGDQGAAILTMSAGDLVVSPAPPQGTLGTAYSYQLAVTGVGVQAVGPFTFSVNPAFQSWTSSYASGLPAGLSLSSTGVLSGTPSLPEQTMFEVSVTDAAGDFSGNDLLTMTVGTGNATLDPTAIPLGTSIAVAEQTNQNDGQSLLQLLEVLLAPVQGLAATVEQDVACLPTVLAGPPYECPIGI